MKKNKNQEVSQENGKKKKSSGKWVFLSAVLALYLVVSFFDKGVVFSALSFSLKTLKQVFFAFIFVFLLMTLSNYYISPQRAKKYVGKGSGIKRWIFAIVGGVISTGPVYVWFGLLKDLRDKGASAGFVSTFLYNKAIKLPLLPLMILYFGFGMSVIFVVALLLGSIVQGIVFEWLEGGELI